MKTLITIIAAAVFACAATSAPAAEAATAEAANGQEAGPTIVKWEYVTGGTSEHETEVASSEPQRVLAWIIHRGCRSGRDTRASAR